MKAERRVITPILRRRAGRLSGAVGASVLVAAGQLAHPFPLKIVLDHVLPGPGAVTLDRSTMVVLLAAGALAVVIVVVEAVAGYIAEVGLQRTGEDVVHDLRLDMFAHLQRLSLGYHQRNRTGDLVTRLTGDVNAAGGVFAESVGRVAQSLALLVGMAVVTLRIDAVLAAAVFVLVPPLALLTLRFRRRLKTASRRQRRHDGIIAATTTEALAAAPTVRALGGDPVEAARLADISRARRDAGVEASTIQGRFSGIIDVLGAVGGAAVLVLGAVRVASGALSVGDLVVVHSYARKLYRPLRDLAREAGRLSRAMARIERIGDVLGSDDVLPDPPHGYRGPPSDGRLTMVDVHFGHAADRGDAVRGVDLHVQAGQHVAIVGPSGAGKSTLAALLARFHDPDRGQVLLDGRDVRDCDLAWLRDQYGFVLQDTVLFTGTVAENIGYGLDADRAHVVEAARIAGAHDFVAALPDGYDTTIGPRGLALSGGQRRRLDIARVLLRDPGVLVLDEPTTGLDPGTEGAVLDGLARVMRSRTTVVVTHDHALARRADLVVLVEGGRITRLGAPDAVLGPTRPPSLPAPSPAARRPRTSPGQIAQTGPGHLPTPTDVRLPQLPTLLRPGAVADLLTRTQDDAPDVRSVHVRYLRYKPTTNLVVHYDVGLADGGTTQAVVMTAADRNLRERAARPLARTLTEHARGRVPVAEPIVHDDRLDALVQWVPVDLWLPAMSAAAVDLLASVPCTSPGPALELLAYKPRRRAVLRVDGHVVKAYADEVAFTAAAHALAMADRLPVPSPGLAGVDRGMQVTVQGVVAGRPAHGTDDARAAGRLLSRLHAAAAPRTMHVVMPGQLLDAAAASARLGATLLPRLRHRLDRLVARLASATPAPGPVVTSHGDFHDRQILVTPDGLVLLDLDELCLAPAGLDVATYASHQLGGRDDDALRLQHVLEDLGDGYGQRPADLAWHAAVAVLRRSPFPFRKQPTPDWPSRLEQMVTAAEETAP